MSIAKTIETIESERALAQAECDRYREALERIAGEFDAGGEYPDSYELGMRWCARIARAALSRKEP